MKRSTNMSDSTHPSKYNPFVLNKVFPDPERTISTRHPTLEVLSRNCLFVLDTNSLLTPFSIGSTAFDDVAKIYRGLCEADRLYVPRYVLREFCKNRFCKIKDLHARLYEMVSSIPATPSVSCPMLESVEEHVALQESLNTLNDAIKEYKKRLQSLVGVIEDWNWEDPVSRLYAELLAGDRIIGSDKNDEELLEDLHRRFAHSLPPGFKDKSKEDEGVGDVIIWHCVLKLGKDKGSNVVFVSNDRKCDWTVNSHKVPIAPRPELVEEFYRETDKHFKIATFSRFLELLSAEDRTVGEVRMAETGQLFRVRERLALVLDTLRQVSFDFTMEDGAGADYHYIQDSRINGLTATFNTLCKDFCGSDASASSHVPAFEELGELLQKIHDTNERLRYMEARMKHDGTKETFELKKLCRRCYELCEALRAVVAV